MAVSEKELKEMAHPKYWDERYISERKKGQEDTQLAILDSYEWYRNFGQLRPFFEKHLPPSSSAGHMLQLGCGNSVSGFLSDSSFFT